MWLVERTGVQISGIDQILWRNSSDFGVTEFGNPNAKFIVELRNTLTNEIKSFEGSVQLVDIMRKYSPYGYFQVPTIDCDNMHVFVSVDEAAYAFLDLIDHVEYIDSSLMLRSIGICVGNYGYAYTAIDDEMSIVERSYVDSDEGHDYRTLFRALIDEPDAMWGGNSVYLPQFYDDGLVESALKVVFNDVAKAKRMLTKGVVLTR